MGMVQVEAELGGAEWVEIALGFCWPLCCSGWRRYLTCATKRSIRHPNVAAHGGPDLRRGIFRRPATKLPAGPESRSH